MAVTSRGPYPACMWLAKFITSVWARVTAFLGIATALVSAGTWLFWSREVSLAWLAAAGWLVAAASWFELFKQRASFAAERTRFTGPEAGSDEWLLAHAFEMEDRMTGEIVRDAVGAAIKGEVQWPDGTRGVMYLNRDSDGAVDTYTVTYEPVGRPHMRVTQPPMKRGWHGAVTHRPHHTVSTI